MIALPPGFYSPDTHWLTGPGGRRHLTPQQHAILMLMVRANGCPVTHERIITTLWPHPVDEPDGPDSVVRVQVCKMRDQLSECGVPRRIVRTEHHIGYYLEV